MKISDVLRGDFDRHGRSFRDLGFWAMAHYRVGHAALDLENPLVRRMSSFAYGAVRLLFDLTCGVQINREASLGPGVHLVHGWNIKIHPDVVVGAHVGIMHDVTLGTNMDRPGLPVIGVGAFIGAGARVLGGVTVGAHARVGANSLVITDVPPGATAVGVPARVVSYTGRSPVPQSTSA